MCIHKITVARGVRDFMNSDRVIAMDILDHGKGNANQIAPFTLTQTHTGEKAWLVRGVHLICMLMVHAREMRLPTIQIFKYQRQQKFTLVHARTHTNTCANNIKHTLASHSCK